jgi:N-acyl-D-aspartate/D-glutamate deacylase
MLAAIPLEEKPGMRNPRLAIQTLIALLAALALPAIAPAAYAESGLDLVIQGGRVIDPASGLDGMRNVGIRDGEIVAVSSEALVGKRMIDATGLVVAPGFIDLHTHSPNPIGQRYQLLDGVTTALELEAGVHPIETFGEEIKGKARINYGASVGWASTRLEAKLGLRQQHLLMSTPRPVSLKGVWTVLRTIFGGVPDEVFVEKATPKERATMRALLEASLDQGALGIGVPVDYFSEGVDEDELRMVFDVAAGRDTILYIHVRRGINGDPAGLREALRLAEETGAAVHICHIQHNAMRNIELFLREIREARARGVDVTTELLPYNAGSALISSAVFGRNWREIFAIDYADVEWAATGMRFNEETWNEYREKHPEGQVVHHYVQEEWTRRALVEPGVIVVSDLLPMFDETSMVAPHNGAFSRVLGRYVREKRVLDLVTALAKMTSMPADRMAAFFPAFERKGRIALGADADLTIFDADTILDRATYGNPFQPSAGIHTVIVSGQVSVDAGSLVENVFAGERIDGPKRAN